MRSPMANRLAPSSHIAVVSRFSSPIRNEILRSSRGAAIRVDLAFPAPESFKHRVKIFGGPVTPSGLLGQHMERKSISAIQAAEGRISLGKEVHDNWRVDEANLTSDPFSDLEERFLEFKRHNFVENRIHYENLSERQTPKFLVISCADSRVCPSVILGFRPGEAFTVRNVANLVPPYQHGASETIAAIEFAVNSLEVPNILVVGHSRCGGIQALMSLEEKGGPVSSFISKWVSIAESAKLSTKAATGHLSFEKQCAHCEKESIKCSLLNLLTYPWIEERARLGQLSLHGGYYDFVNCTFENWTMVNDDSEVNQSKVNYVVKNHSRWS